MSSLVFFFFFIVYVDWPIDKLIFYAEMLQTANKRSEWLFADCCT